MAVGVKTMETFAKASTLKFLNVSTAGKRKLIAKTKKSGKHAQVAKVSIALPLVKIKGLPVKTFKLLGDQLDMKPADIASLAGIPIRTYHRRQGKKQTLNASESDATLRIARIVEEASRVFGDAKRATRWLRTKHAQLGDAPIQLLNSDAGTLAVQDELTRIHWGDFA
jgi:putative toxin-antitoxin system antitoxin component (TIGR02293 family)